ncbi:hypothetical protein [Hydrogenophaga palleronii]|uniref:hypothetical protein n=1 Tax=Hydrogenophaga palleronii TaxID=65655 RepID=UPI00082641D0|nr:hypothetical protein [Hydrogenophaga palleronii]
MSVENTAWAHGECLRRLTQTLVIRTLGQIADEAREDGESLQQLVERYEIDYAWQVLGSTRLHDAALAAVQERLGRPADEALRARLTALLQAAAAQQPNDALMSFDNDVPALLSELLCEGIDAESGSLVCTPLAAGMAPSQA